MATRRTPPWEKPKPKASKGRTKLSADSVKWAKARARKAGRKYPNLVDNMAATKRQMEKSAGSKTSRDRP